MRILHTADWHLGRTFHGADLRLAHEAALDTLVETVRRERVDLVLVAGDVCDRAVPPVEALELYDDTVRRFVDAGAAVVVTSGNHDSARRLRVNSRLLEAAGVHVRTDVSRVGEPVLVADEHGPVAVHPLPWLEPSVAGRDLGDPALRSHSGVLGAAMGRVREDLASRPGVRSVVASHAFVAGGAASDSEREIAVGGVAVVPAAVFSGVDYVALGHLHRPQEVVAGVRYSGSPIAFSFSEGDGGGKQAALVELGAHGLVRTEPVPMPVHRPLARLQGTLESLLADPEHSGAEPAFVEVVLTDPVRPLDAMARLTRRFPWCVSLHFRPAGALCDPEGGYAAKTRGRTDLEIAEAFVAHVSGAPAAPDEQEMLAAALDDVAAGARRSEAREPAAAGSAR
jgi:DNA repair protein SbcD/Mre11